MLRRGTYDQVKTMRTSRTNLTHSAREVCARFDTRAAAWFTKRISQQLTTNRKNVTSALRICGASLTVQKRFEWCSRRASQLSLLAQHQRLGVYTESSPPALSSATETGVAARTTSCLQLFAPPTFASIGPPKQRRLQIVKINAEKLTQMVRWV